MSFSCTEQVIYQTTLPPFSRTLTIMNGSMHGENTSTPKNVRAIVITRRRRRKRICDGVLVHGKTLDEYHRKCNISRRYHLR